MEINFIWCSSRINFGAILIQSRPVWLFYYHEPLLSLANYADDNKPYVSGRNIKGVVASLEEVSEVTFQWFRDNQFQGTASKCHVLLSADK